MRLSEVLKGLEFNRSGPVADREVGRITNDSRLAGPLDMFVAFRGYAKDGYGFIDAAVSRDEGKEKRVIRTKSGKTPTGGQRLFCVQHHRLDKCN